MFQQLDSKCFLLLDAQMNYYQLVNQQQQVKFLISLRSELLSLSLPWDRLRKKDEQSQSH